MLLGAKANLKNLVHELFSADLSVNWHLIVSLVLNRHKWIPGATVAVCKYIT